MMATGSKIFLVVLFLVTLSCILILQISMDGWIPRGERRLLSFVDQKEGGPSKKSHIPYQSDNVSYITTNKPTHLFQISSSMRAWPLINGTLEKAQNFSAKLGIPPPTAPTRIQVTQLRVGKIVHPSKSFSLSSHRRHANVSELLIRNEMAKLLPKAIKAIQSMPTVKPENVIRVFLITYFRSGSSFVGELLQQNWKTFYQFEPLHYMTYGARISDSRAKEAFELFHGIYHCNFTNLNNYFNWVRGKRNQFLFSRSLFLWFSCRMKAALCFDPRFVSAVCSRAPVQVVKVTRLRMSQLRAFLQENPDLNIKVVYLTRDPRGIVSSRWTLDWCNETDCSDPAVLCNEMEDDMSVFNEMQASEPSKFIQVRYEDMALDPKKETVRLFKFLHLPFSSSVQRYLKSHSVARKADNLNPYSTRRNSSSMAFSWRSRFTFEKVKIVQSFCSNIIEKLNFSLISTPTELRSQNNHLVQTIRINSSSVNQSINTTEARNQLMGNEFQFLNKRHKRANSRL